MIVGCNTQLKKHTRAHMQRFSSSLGQVYKLIKVENQLKVGSKNIIDVTADMRIDYSYVETGIGHVVSYCKPAKLIKGGSSKATN